MPAFPRTIVPSAVTMPEMASPLMAPGGTGKTQIRGTVALGRRWTETYNGLKASDPVVRSFLAVVNNYFHKGTLFDIEHYLLNTKLGGMTGSPLVNGASQTGESLAIDGCSGTNPVFKAGDLFTLPNFNVVFDVVEDAPNLVSGGCTIKINPSIPVGQSPADNAALTYSAPVRFKQVFIAERPSWPEVGPNVVINGFRLVFQEQP